MPTTSKRGFASMDLTRQREIASRGGKAAHEKGTAHEFTADEARAAGRKGGLAVSANTEHMAQIGRQGGRARSASLKRQATQHSSSSDAVIPRTLMSGSGEEESRSEVILPAEDNRPNLPGANA